MKSLRAMLFIAAFAAQTVPGAEPPLWSPQTPLEEARVYLGAAPSAHALPSAKRTEAAIARGRDLFEKRRAVGPDGVEGSIQSEYFSCTHCHLSVREDPDLARSDPDARFAYLCDRSLPLLPGTTLWGTVNKRSWYNGDYVKKYGESVKAANESLIEAIQLCARECSQGRAYLDWELEAVTAYFWSLQYTLGDLGLSSEDIEQLRVSAADSMNHAQVLHSLDSRYLAGSPATFGSPPPDFEKGYNGEGEYFPGGKVFAASCLHCHAKEAGVLGWPYTFAYNRHTFSFLKRYFPKDHHWSSYVALRKGTSTGEKKGPYMPNYTLERMSDQRIEDLRHFVMEYRKRRCEEGAVPACGKD